MTRLSVFSDHCEGRWQLGNRALRASRFWHHALILGAVLSLTINVATRYCNVTAAETQTLKTAKAHSLDGQRQHLLNDGAHWSAPAATLVLFQPAEVSSVPLPAVASVLRPRSEDYRSSRPPPSS